MYDFVVMLASAIALIWGIVASKTMGQYMHNECEEVPSGMLLFTMIGALVPLAFAVGVPLRDPNWANIMLGTVTFVLVAVVCRWAGKVFVEARDWHEPYFSLDAFCMVKSTRAVPTKLAFGCLVAAAGLAFILRVFASS